MYMLKKYSGGHEVMWCKTTKKWLVFSNTVLFVNLHWLLAIQLKATPGHDVSRLILACQSENSFLKKNQENAGQRGISKSMVQTVGNWSK